MVRLHQLWLAGDPTGVCANFSGQDLSNINLRGKDLRKAYFHGTDLTNADLRGANLCETNLKGAKLTNVMYDFCTPFFAMQCPEKGKFIAFKKQELIFVTIEY